jgi:sarcosine oxidase delta subunit
VLCGKQNPQALDSSSYGTKRGQTGRGQRVQMFAKRGQAHSPADGNAITVHVQVGLREVDYTVAFRVGDVCVPRYGPVQHMSACRHFVNCQRDRLGQRIQTGADAVTGGAGAQRV